MISVPDPNVMIGHNCQPIPIEMIVRGFITGVTNTSLWHAYQNGSREFCGNILPSGLVKNQKLEKPIITPSTHGDAGAHDVNMSRQEILDQKIVSQEIYSQMESAALKLFARGTEICRQKGLILVDTKYEFGKKDGKVYLIDEIHTPDSSRYFYAEGYQQKFEKGEEQKQLSKEFVRQWLIEHNFMGKDGQKVPEMTTEYVNSVSDRYIELYEHIVGSKFQKATEANIAERIEKNVLNYLNSTK